MQITEIHAREVLDSRGRPTVEVEVAVDRAIARAIVPSGASTGRHEALELRDDGSRFGGLGVRQAVQHVNTLIAEELRGSDPHDQRQIDRRLCELDGTPDKSRLGANAILGVSLACARVTAKAQRRPLVDHLGDLWRDVHSGDAPASMPLPMVNIISGGLHAGGQLDIQDFLILPVGAATYSESLEWISAVYRQLGSTLSTAGYEGVLVGDEGGYGPKLPGNERALELLVEAIKAANLEPGLQVAIGLDVAATHFYRDGTYQLSTDSERRTASELIELLAEWVRRYPIISIEDGLAEDDWSGWKTLTERLGDCVQLIGDDLFVTNTERLQRGIDQHIANSVLIKLNQIGTLTETLETLQLAVSHEYAPVVSARSGDTEDAFIADLAVATGAGQIKIGSIARSERLAKYNQLLRLEERLGNPPLAVPERLRRLSAESP